jgi:MFS family permease
VQLLRTNDDFRRLWLAQTISQIGNQLSYLAIPLTAAVTLDATAMEMGLLTAAGAMPALVIGVLAGAVIDRRARRPLLIGSDLGNAALIAFIPLAWWLDILSVPLLLAVAVLCGLCSLVFDIAYQAFLPEVVLADELVEGNSNLELSRSAAEITGPAIAGGLIQLVKAPVALLVDAGSFLVSAFLIARIRTIEGLRHTSDSTTSIWREAADGLQEIRSHDAVRTLAVTAAGIGLANAMVEAVIILYLTRSIGIQPGVLGMVFAAGSVGFVVGALVPTTLTERFGVGPTMALALLTVGLSDLVIPLVGANVLVVSLVVALSQFFFGLGITVFNVSRRTLVQALVPNRSMGRVGGTLKTIGMGIVPVGAFAGGSLGSVVGLQATLVLGAMLETVVAVWLWRSSLWSMRAIPAG